MAEAVYLWGFCNRCANKIIWEIVLSNGSIYGRYCNFHKEEVMNELKNAGIE